MILDLGITLINSLHGPENHFGIRPLTNPQYPAALHQVSPVPAVPTQHTLAHLDRYKI